MDQIGLPLLQDAIDHAILAAIDNRRLLLHILQPETPQEVFSYAWLDFDPLKRELLLAHPLLADDKRFVAIQTTYLPVNVEHFRLEKRGAIAGNSWHGGGLAGNRDGNAYKQLGRMSSPLKQNLLYRMDLAATFFI